MTDALARKRSIHGAHRASATRLMNQTDNTLAVNPVNSNELQIPETGLANKLTLLRQLDVEIVRITPEKDTHNHMPC